MQDAMNSAVTSISNNLLYSQAGQTVVPASVAKDLPKGTVLFQQPGVNLVLPDQHFTKFGPNLIVVIPPPKLPDNAYRSLEEMNKIFDILSGNNDVQRGQGSPNAESGVAIESLQQAGSVDISLKAKSLEFVLQHMAKVAIDCLIKFLPEYEWIAYCTGSPPE